MQSTERQKARELNKRLTILYDVLDHNIAAGMEQSGLKPSCGTECYGCCYLMVAITAVEGLAIADHLLKQQDWREWMQKIRDASVSYIDMKMTREEHFRKGIPCVFLGADKKCSIYANRPSPCRYYFVVSDPKLCYPDAGTQKVGIVNTLEIEAHVWKFSADTLGDFGKMSAPLPIMVLFCAEMLVRGTPRHKIVKKLGRELPDPFTWSRENQAVMKNDPEETQAIAEAVMKVGLQP